MWAGSAASSGGTPWLSAKKARKEPASSFSAPSTIQPGPALISAIHHDALEVRRSRGRNRRKSTCSPICATSENTTEDATPNSNRSK